MAVWGQGFESAMLRRLIVSKGMDALSASYSVVTFFIFINATNVSWKVFGRLLAISLISLKLTGFASPYTLDHSSIYALPRI